MLYFEGGPRDFEHHPSVGPKQFLVAIWNGTRYEIEGTEGWLDDLLETYLQDLENDLENESEDKWGPRGLEKRNASN